MDEIAQGARRRGRLTRIIVTIVLLAPLALVSSLFIWTAEGHAVAVDTALSLGLGREVEGRIAYEGCAAYVEGQYPGSRNVDRGTRCTMVIEANGERALRPIDLDHPEALAAVSRPGRAFGALGAAMPAGVLLDRLGRFGTLLVIALVCLVGLVSLWWSWRRAALQPARALN